MTEATHRPSWRRTRTVLSWALLLILLGVLVLLMFTPRELVTPGRVSQITVGMPRSEVKALLGPTTLEQSQAVGLMGWSVGAPTREDDQYTSHFYWSKPGGTVYRANVTYSKDFHHGRADQWASPALYVMVSYDEQDRVMEVAQAPASIDERWTGPWYRRVENFLVYWKTRAGL